MGPQSFAEYIDVLPSPDKHGESALDGARRMVSEVGVIVVPLAEQEVAGSRAQRGRVGHLYLEVQDHM